MMKSLCLSERRCTPEVMDVSFKGSDLQGHEYKPMSKLGFKERVVNKV